MSTSATQTHTSSGPTPTGANYHAAGLLGAPFSATEITSVPANYVRGAEISRGVVSP
jgi:hypothetical protein